MKYCSPFHVHAESMQTWRGSDCLYLLYPPTSVPTHAGLFANIQGAPSVSLPYLNLACGPLLRMACTSLTSLFKKVVPAGRYVRGLFRERLENVNETAGKHNATAWSNCWQLYHAKGIPFTDVPA